MKIIFFANTDWYLYNYRLSLATELQSQGHEIILLSPAGSYTAAIQKAGLNWQEFSLSRRGINPFSELNAINRLAHFYKQEKPDLVHHFTIKCVIYGSLAARKAGINRIINSITGKGILFSDEKLVNSLGKPFIKLLYRLSLKQTEVVFQNQPDFNYFVDNHLVSSQQCHLIPGSGVDVTLFKPAPVPEGDPLVILPARMLWAKGVHEFIQAARIIKKTGVNARFALVGEPDTGNPSAIPVQKLKEWNTDGSVEWWGWKDDMVQIYQAASIVCLPSSYGEGMAKSLLEAAACGRPIIASDIPGCREVIIDNVNGFLVPRQDSEQLAAAIIKLLSSKPLREKMGHASRELAVRHFSSEKVNQDTIDLYIGL